MNPLSVLALLSVSVESITEGWPDNGLACSSKRGKGSLSKKGEVILHVVHEYYLSKDWPP